MSANTSGAGERPITAFIDCGGPEFDIQVDGVCYHFEMHPYCGPVRLDNEGNEHPDQAERFLYAASLWAQQGKRMEDGLCRWDHEPQEILQHLGRNTYLFLGHEPAKKGE